MSEFQIPRPGVEQARLQPFVGTFRAEVKIFMGPGEPQISTGTMTNSFQVDGLYLHQDYQGDQMSPEYPAFIGRGYWGFNFASQKYEGFWIDNASSMMQTETGEVDSSGKVWTMTSEFQSPQDGSLISKRSEIRLTDDAHHFMISYMTPANGQEFKTMEISYTRIN